MNLDSIFGPSVVAWVVLPLLIFCARIMDVSIGTIRIIMLSKGFLKLAPILGFLESFIWIIAVSQIMLHLNNFFYYIAYAAGFGTGTFVGMVIEQKLSLGYVVLRIITNQEANELAEFIRNLNYPVTSIDAKGRHGDVKVIFMVIKRSKLVRLLENVKRFNPNAFYTVEDVRFVSGGVFPVEGNPVLSKKSLLYTMKRK